MSAHPNSCPQPLMDTAPGQTLLSVLLSPPCRCRTAFLLTSPSFMSRPQLRPCGYQRIMKGATTILASHHPTCSLNQQLCPSLQGSRRHPQHEVHCPRGNMRPSQGTPSIVPLSPAFSRTCLLPCQVSAAPVPPTRSTFSYPLGKPHSGYHCAQCGCPHASPAWHRLLQKRLQPCTSKYQADSEQVLVTHSFTGGASPAWHPWPPS